MAKKIKSTENTNLEAEVQAVQTQEVAKASKESTTVVADKKANDKKKADKSKKNPKEKGKLKRKAKETISEIKKVNWPTFGEVCKRTGVVLVVVLVFAVVIFGIDYGLGALMSLLTK